MTRRGRLYHKGIRKRKAIEKAKKSDRTKIWFGKIKRIKCFQDEGGPSLLAQWIESGPAD